MSSQNPPAPTDTPSLSIVVVAYNMARELPRTLETLSRPYQRSIEEAEYEIIVVDNGSQHPVNASDFDRPNLTYLAMPDPTASPVAAANYGIQHARGDCIGLLIDGARMVTPGLLSAARSAMTLAQRPIVATLAFHLGTEPQMIAARSGYDQRIEDRLLDSIDWRTNGYQLFDIATFAGSSHRGWFGPMGESNALFMPAELWHELGGLDPIFTRAGGGLANHDLYRRACEHDDTELIMILGEASFHQFHGGAATGGQANRKELWAEYESFRGRPYKPPTNEALYVGAMPPEAARHLDRSLALHRDRRSKTGRQASTSGSLDS